MAALSDPEPEISCPAFQTTIATLAGPRRENGASARSWREELPRLRPPRGPQGADHRWRFRHGPGCRDRLCARRRRCRHQLFSERGAGRPGGHPLIKDAGRKGLAIPGDLRDEAFCKRLVERCGEGLGGLDILVCNAARQQTRESILEVSSEDFDATMKTNIYAPFWIIKAALPHLKPGSAIIGTTSEQAYDPSPELYDYAQTKAATMNYVKSLAKQLGPEGHSGQWRRAGSDLDAAPGVRRRQHGEARTVWRPHRIQAAGPTGRARLDLRPTRRGRRQLHHRPGVWLVGRRRPAVTRARLPLGSVRRRQRRREDRSEETMHGRIRQAAASVTWASLVTLLESIN